MTGSLFSKKVSAKEETTTGTEYNLLISLDRDEKEASINHSKAKTEDLKANTKLKIFLTVFICLLIILWFIFLYDSLSVYFENLFSLKKEIPKEVMLGIITSGASVIGLMTFILKGLFKSD